VNDQTFISLTGALLNAQGGQTQMANCTMHLFKSGFNPNPANVLADFAAQECDFDGYSAAAIATWAAPVLAGQGYAIYAPTQTFRWTFSSAGTGNTVGGYYLVTSGGVLKEYCVFGSPIPMASAGQAVIKTPIEVYPAG